jgi:hypothetical protein
LTIRGIIRKNGHHTLPCEILFVSSERLIKQIVMYFNLIGKVSRRNNIMTKLPLKEEAIGTRTGYVIRFACPSCLKENVIINKTPKDSYRETRDATCRQCKKHFNVITPGMFEKKVPM